jgi:hypothetical protein
MTKRIPVLGKPSACMASEETPDARLITSTKEISPANIRKRTSAHHLPGAPPDSPHPATCQAERCPSSAAQRCRLRPWTPPQTAPRRTCIQPQTLAIAVLAKRRHLDPEAQGQSEGDRSGVALHHSTSTAVKLGVWRMISDAKLSKVVVAGMVWLRTRWGGNSSCQRRGVAGP